MPASKNLLRGKTQLIGRRAEQDVIEYFEKQGWSLVFQGLKTEVAEIDLIVEKKEFILLVEVKKISNSWQTFERVHKKQLNKLIQNKIIFTQHFKQKKIQAVVAWIDHFKKISIVEIEL